MPELENKSNKTGGKKVFYEPVLDEATQLDFRAAASIEGIDEEIALLRVIIKDLLANKSENTRLIITAANTLIRLVTARHMTSPKAKEGLKDAVENVIKEVGIPMGLAEVLKRMQCQK